MERELRLPGRVAFVERARAGRIRQLASQSRRETVATEDCPSPDFDGKMIVTAAGRRILVVGEKVAPPAGVAEVLYVAGGLDALIDPPDDEGPAVEWLSPEPGGQPASEGEPAELARQSWQGSFFFREEVVSDGAVVQPGLRPPQMGALHAAIAHWRVTDDLATVVMPTGTGKTDTMLALLVCERLGRLLVVVPTSALRDQIGRKFATLGVLKPAGVVGPAAHFPVVGLLEHRPRTVQEAGQFFGRCNVVVTTMSVISGCDEPVQRAMADASSHLFLDEAHHTSAQTWDVFRQRFLPRPVLQFTATPFRGDGKHVDGRVIFNYPLRKAQQGGYFKPINFRAISEFRPGRADRAIALAAVEQLEKDDAAGFRHLVMARVSTIARATAVLEVYREVAASYRPMLVHSKQSAGETREALAKLRAGETRVIICVDMLGEGFDLPALKIAALHDMHKSLAITLQFTGRFTRASDQLGDATMIANIADAKVEESLRELYAEDPDWNLLIRVLSEGATGKQLKRSDFLDAFIEVPPGLSLQNVFPKMSTVVYRTKCPRWRPDEVHRAIDEKRMYAAPTVNRKDRVLVFVTREREPISWGNMKEMENVVWDLYILHWDEARQLLFVHSSNTGGNHEKLAGAIGGSDPVLVRGEQVFRVFHGINRIMLMNLGLNHSMSRAVRFTMHVGGDIIQAITDSHLQNRVKSNVFGRGFEGGAKVTIGCSHKGRIWSYQIAGNIADWVEWCGNVGRKVLDDSISPEDFLDHVIVPTPLTARPALFPLAIEWSEALLERSEETLKMDIAGEVAPFFDVGLELVEPDVDGPLRFRVFSGSKSSTYEVDFAGETVRYRPVASFDVELVQSRKRTKLSEWFQVEPPVIRFEDGAFLVYNDLFKARKSRHRPFDRERIQAWDWTGTDITKESQRAEKRPDSIQHRVIRELCVTTVPDYDVVFNDDETNEAADVVALKIAGDNLLIHFFHCKYSQEATPGARLKDLYEVCGQAQKSVFWKGNIEHLFDHLRLRDEQWLARQNVSRFEKGDPVKLDFIARRAPLLNLAFRISIVQPGLSLSQVRDGHLDLLAVTELYLKETYAIDFGVIASS